MRYLALACDYDGTLAYDGWMDRETADALRKVRDTGRRLVLVTGRELPDLLAIVPEPELFDRIVAENGALLYRPATREERALADPPPETLVSALIERRVEPLSIGRSLIATRVPNETTVLDVIRQLGLERQVVFNKGAVMVLPSGVNKASGLDAALAELGVSPHNCVAVGDAENDHAFLSRVECAVAVANALPALKEIADLVTAGDHGRGVRELVDRLVADDLVEVESRLTRHAIPLGARADGGTVDWPPYGRNLLIAGPSASGKSTIAGGVLDRLTERGYQYCILDPEGDYTSASGAVVLGDPNRAPTLAEMLDVLKTPGQSVVMNLVGIALEHRPEFFAGAIARLQELRVKTGRPHQIVIDEAHHLMPADWIGAPLDLPKTGSGLVMITVHPGHVMRPMLKVVDAVVVVGTAPAETVREFAGAIGRPAPELPTALDPGELLLWSLAGSEPVERLRSIPSRSERRRHLRKYAEGDLGEGRSFYFRGPEGKLNLRAQNLVLFLQVADGVDDETWRHHLARHHYSQWLRDAIKDQELAAEVEAIEERPGLDARASRDLVRTAISQRYTV
jgi:hypothetical protein